jgi:hypothetical protein
LNTDQNSRNPHARIFIFDKLLKNYSSTIEIQISTVCTIYLGYIILVRLKFKKAQRNKPPEKPTVSK